MNPPADLALLRLLQLASPTLPVGSYAYSQGMEWAVAAGWVHDERTLAAWIDDQLRHSVGRVDVPVFSRLFAAAEAGDHESLRRWSRELVVRRETSELVADDCDRGRALARLLRDLGVAGADGWATRRDAPFAALFAVAACAWQVSLPAAVQAYVWSWLENQVLVGIKLIPLGQVSGQRLLLEMAPGVPAVCEHGLLLGDDDIGGTLPIVAVASSLHETQYTRLFRS